MTFIKTTFIQNNKTIRLSDVWHELLISASSETAVSQQQPKVETQQTSSSSHEEKVLDDGTVVQMSSSSARKTSSSSQEMTIPISFGQLTRQSSQAKTPRYSFLKDHTPSVVKGFILGLVHTLRIYLCAIPFIFRFSHFFAYKIEFWILILIGWIVPVLWYEMLYVTAIFFVYLLGDF